MEQYIYKSEFLAGPEATERQEALFTTDLNYAISKKYGYIQMSDGKVFLIDEDKLIEVEITEEELQELAKIEEESLTDESEDYCIKCHNLTLIDQIINNTLKQNDDITPQQADTLLKLANLKNILVRV